MESEEDWKAPGGTQPEVSSSVVTIPLEQGLATCALRGSIVRPPAHHQDLHASPRHFLSEGRHATVKLKLGTIFYYSSYYTASTAEKFSGLSSAAF